MKVRGAPIGFAIVSLVIFMAFAAPIVAPQSPFRQDLLATLQAPSAEHLFGTDDLGRDMLARIFFGGRISIAVGLFAMAVSIIIGTLVGAFAGFVGGATDFILSRFTDLFQSLPAVPVLLLVTYLFRDEAKRILGRELGIFFLIVGVIGALTWMTTARLVRGSFLSLKTREFVEAAHALGVSRLGIMFRHILPNALGPIIVAATLNVGGAIITESVLSFLGVGFEADWPTWGSLVFSYKDYIGINNQAVLLPAFGIFITVLAVNYMGEGLRDAFDPRRGR